MQPHPNEPSSDHRTMVKTKTPGIFKRGSRYVVVFRDAEGKQRKESTRTLDEARAVKAKRTTQVASGEFQEQSRITFHEYAKQWVASYQGGRHGIREASRKEYERVLTQYALEHFPPNLRLSQMRLPHVKAYVAWLAEERDGKRLAHKSVRNYLGPVSACLESAREDGLILHNPARGVRVPRPATVESVEAEDVRVLTRDQLAGFLAVVHSGHRLFFELLAATGLRVSEAIALEWRHLHLGEQPLVKVRQGIVRGELGAPKTRHSRRDVPLPPELARKLLKARMAAKPEQSRDDALVFSAPRTQGKPLHVGNLRRRVLKPAATQVGAPWAGFHTFRHTCASLLFAEGRNAVQVQHWLGHHSAAFTLGTYVHLLDGDVGGPLSLAADPAAAQAGSAKA
jgi:integrase